MNTLARLLAIVTSTFLVLGTRAMSQTCTLDSFQELRRQVEKMDYVPAFEVLRQESSIFLERKFVTPGGNVVSFLAKCLDRSGYQFEVGFLFAVDVEGMPTSGETHVFLSGEESFDDFPFMAKNYSSEEAVSLAAMRYLRAFEGDFDSAILSLRKRGFFVHNDYLDSDQVRHVVVVKEPFPQNSLAHRIGGNGSPNTPASFCINSAAQLKGKFEISRTRECKFRWNTYVDQVNKILTLEQTHEPD